MLRWVQSADASTRLQEAKSWLRARAAGEEVVLVAPTVDAANALIREAVEGTGAQASFGWHRQSLSRLAARLAAPSMADDGVVPASHLALEALCARVIDQADDLGRYARVADRPGLPRALVTTFAELRVADVDVTVLPEDLANIYRHYVSELESSRLADRAGVFARATRAVASEAEPLVGLPSLLIDPHPRGIIEARLIRALVEASDDVLMTSTLAYDRAHALLTDIAGREPEFLNSEARTDLARLQRTLFRDQSGEEPPESSDAVSIFSTPGEALECVEIARRIHEEARTHGVPFDRMAILLRGPMQYRAYLEEALRRADIPAYFAQGTVKPDSSGRAFLALLACAADNLSATRFAEYLSLSQTPDATDGGEPPEAPPDEERWTPPDSDLVSDVITAALQAEPEEELPDDVMTVAEDRPVVAGSLRAPRRWERLMMDAAVIGGLDRWEKRLAALEHERRLDLDALEDPDDPAAELIERDLAALRALTTFALPLLRTLADRPTGVTTWGAWLDWLSELASRALRRPERVQATLAELAPMREVGGVDLREVRLVLMRRLTDLLTQPGTDASGRVYICDIESARGLAFDVVFVPGLAEKLFPQKLVEDPILSDRLRADLDGLDTHADRARSERSLLQLAVGAAHTRVHLSYPRLDVNQSRPRVPSFYGLEVLRAAHGALPDFGELMQRAQAATPTRLGWPAPGSPMSAIDEAEHDLALLAEIFRRRDDETVGMARYLLEVNPHLSRALRFRARRWFRNWTSADGFVKPSAAGQAALDRQGLDQRSFSPTALQQYAQCPYKFFLYAILRLKPKEEVTAIDVMNPLQRGSLVHEVLYELHVRMREKAMLPVTPDNLESARALLSDTIDDVAGKWKELLSPIVPKVWVDELALIRGDLNEWLRREADGEPWLPEHFELSFGLPGRRDKDPASVDEAVPLDCGIRLRGSIDLVERGPDGRLRATDYKTGQVRVNQDAVIGGGKALQPVLYALVLEKLTDAKVEGGRLYYCTTAGNFSQRRIRLTPTAREAANAVADTIGRALSEGFLPAAPEKYGCRWCDYQPVCGPYEEYRTQRKPREALKPLNRLRDWK